MVTMTGKTNVIVSESSYVTSVDEPISLTDQCTQTTPAPPVRPLRHHTSKLQRHHTCDHIYDVKKNIYGLNRTSLGILKESGSRSRGLGFSDSCPFIVSRGARKLNGFTAVNSWDKPAESPTLSLTSPTSLDYLVNRGGGSPAGSLTPNGILPKQVTSTGVYLTPGYLQNSFPCNQSLSEVALTVGCEEPPTPRTHATSEGLSWRRLHMSRAKLKATATTSELLSGFAMVAMVELQINEPTNVPEWLFVMFAVCTTVLVAVHIFALMISTYLLPNIDAVSKLESPNSCALRDSPHERMRGFIELAWAFSTVLGLFLFLVEVAILCWVKFWDYSFAAATAATVIVIPVLIVFVAFAVHFYHTLVVQKVRSSGEDMEQLENMKRDLDSATVKVNIS